MVFAAILSLAVIPHAIDVGHDVYAQTLHTAEIQARTRTPVQATVVSDATTPTADNVAPVVSISWTVNGTSHTGVVRPARSNKVGDTVGIWVDETGRRVPPPMSTTSVGTYATAAAVAVWLGATTLFSLALVAARKLLDRRRFRTWSAELRLLLDRGDGRTKWHH